MQVNQFDTIQRIFWVRIRNRTYTLQTFRGSGLGIPAPLHTRASNRNIIAANICGEQNRKMCAILRSPGKCWWRAYVAVLPVLRRNVRRSDGVPYERLFKLVIGADFGDLIPFLSAGN